MLQVHDSPPLNQHVLQFAQSVIFIRLLGENPGRGRLLKNILYEDRGFAQSPVQTPILLYAIFDHVLKPETANPPKLRYCIISFFFYFSLPTRTVKGTPIGWILLFFYREYAPGGGKSPIVGGKRRCEGIFQKTTKRRPEALSEVKQSR